MARWEDVLDQLVRERHGALVAYAALLTGDRREAEDLVQDALVRTFSRGSADGGLHRAEGYVRSAILSTYVDGFRRRRRWAAVRHLVAQDAPRAQPGPERTSPDRLDLRSALDLLPPRQRACVVLRFYEDLTVPQIGEALRVSTGAAKRYLSEGVHALERALGPLDLSTDDGAVDVHLDARSGSAPPGRRTTTARTTPTGRSGS
ncbi:sigma-70 family RNA polymerase sigma factor [Actinotalea sp. Marseille-Q4924]|uniref:sigma-70 family RNA polymerase sigma factor n=1 Tax=Actinotalea sp. Marseille-Q4924 TaxID=2866571 RepID=UPI001CE45835|nr:sigma-70 family RNA polymerase sigma factor [Actinotalea sp. Marseille-Q4924]